MTLVIPKRRAHAVRHWEDLLIDTPDGGLAPSGLR